MPSKFERNTADSVRNTGEDGLAGKFAPRWTPVAALGAAGLAVTLAMAPLWGASPGDQPDAGVSETSGSVSAQRPALLPAGRGMAVSGVVGTASNADTSAARTGSVTAPTYLALGDSIAFGYDPLAGHAVADNSVGYPAEVATTLLRSSVNASCPGETAASFRSATVEDNGCRTFRAAYPLHVGYAGTQLDFATAYLRSHPTTNLVTLGIGINDLYHCNRVTADKCVRELDATLENYRLELNTIVRGLRAVYAGPLDLVDYYSPDYQDLRMTDAVTRLNAIMAQTARAHQAGVARTFGVFAGPDRANARNICTAGLLIKLPHRCDIHPSPSGRELLAAAVTRAAQSTGPARPAIDETNYGGA